jgi:4-hydroxy-tetrahydrodipicolinate synthase
MIESGASGVLCMGSMGKMATIRDREYPAIAKRCAAIVARRVPVMVGVMDCSASRVIDRIEALGRIEIEGVVATTPFYSRVSAGGAINFFKQVSETSKYPVYIYDLPSVTQTPVTGDILKALMGMPNIKGVKTANLDLILEFQRNNLIKDGFSVFYSGLDLFDVALKAGIGKNLDGMFTCTPSNSKKMYENVEKGNNHEISACLNNILLLRNVFIRGGVFSSYTYAMELLGFPGDYHPDYDVPVSGEIKEEIYSCMKAIKEI